MKTKPRAAMSTLDDLYLAVIAAPADRTVRLVYADALDETGDPAAAARAEYIRGQIAAEAGHPAAPPPMRLEELFDAHWLDWWRPVCAAAGLPPVPRARGRRVRDRVARVLAGTGPYTAAGDTVRLTECGVAVRFAGGFPEEVRFGHFDGQPDMSRVIRARWGEAMPLVRLGFGWPLAAGWWSLVDGPHLARLPELAFGELAPEAAAAVAASPHLGSVVRLSAATAGPADGYARFLVANPPWAGLRALHLAGPLGPPAVRLLAGACTLPRLEELDLTLGNPAAPGGVWQLLSRLTRAVLTDPLRLAPPADTRWRDFGPAVEALAAAPWVRRLRRLRVRAGRAVGGDFLPDAAARALADAADAGKLDSLVLPAGVVRGPVREELAARPGGRVSFA